MINLDADRFRTRPFAHQVTGAAALVSHNAFALFDEMGAGKTKQVVDAACALSDADEIDTVVVVAPASVKSVWLDPERGEIRKHAWQSSRVLEYHSLRRGSFWHEAWRASYRDAWREYNNHPSGRELTWIVTNYEFLRKAVRDERDNIKRPLIDVLLKALSEKKVLLVLDEAHWIKSRTSQQSKAILALRQVCRRCVLLTGTPVANNPLDLWSQLFILDRTILRRFKNFYAFRWRYAQLGGWQNKQVIGWQNLKELRQLAAPHCLRRLKADCLDLPPKLRTTREVALTPATWKIYKELRREAILALPDRETRIEPNAAVRLIRLAQLTSGIIGGGFDNLMESTEQPELNFDLAFTPKAVEDISDEKLTWAIEHLTRDEAPMATIVWCRFRRERERLAAALRATAPDGQQTFELYGGQGKKEREEAVTSFSTPGGQRRVLIAQPHAGGLGLSLVAATEAIYLSNDYSLTARLQSEDRCHRPGQEHPVTYVDVLATGPDGQHTVDHAVARALEKKEELSTWTCAAWRRALEEEEQDGLA